MAKKLTSAWHPMCAPCAADYVKDMRNINHCPYRCEVNLRNLPGALANIQAKEARQQVGLEFPLMVDCYMALTVPYTIELCKRIDKEVPGGVKWVEEFLQPDNYNGYSQVHQVVQLLESSFLLYIITFLLVHSI